MLNKIKQNFLEEAYIIKNILTDNSRETGIQFKQILLGKRIDSLLDILNKLWHLDYQSVEEKSDLQE